MAIVKIRINGNEISADSSKTILNVARENGIEIPTLCYDPRLPPYGSCLVCVVEVKNTGRLLMSCTTPVAEGMDIFTHSPAAVSARRSALEMLLSNHWADCRGPCYVKCPANVDVQGYLAYANAGLYMEALELIRMTNPMPLICGRVCVRYCEANCRRKDVDSPVAINFMKRYVTDLEYDNLQPSPNAEKNGKKVAVIGGGPAGLTCSYYLALLGYAVTIFDKQPKLGGMLRYGIPDYRLPQDLLDKEIGLILAHGIEAKTEVKLGTDFTLDSLKSEGYDAIFLGMGSWVAKGMGVEGEDNPAILPGIRFLEGVKRDGPPEMKGTVAIVGGGNTAVDAARTALRCGADKVAILYRRTRAEMPADKVEIEDAIHEGVDIQFLIAPKKAVVENGKFIGLECYRMELGEPDASGRRRPVQVKGSEFVYKCDYVVSAIGQDQELSGLKNASVGEIKLTKWKSIEGDPGTFMTSVPGVFTGGDVMTGPAAAIDAIGAGRKAAWVIHGFVQNGKAEPFKNEFLSRRTALSPIDKSFFDGIEQTARSRMEQRDVKERVCDFDEADLGVSGECVEDETSRCLTCGCQTVFNCDLKDYSTEYQAKQDHYSGKVKKYKADTRHPYIVLDQNKCVSCGRCVRYCGDLIGVHALGFVNRGFDTVVRPALDKALEETTCISCGNCIEVCPTGAIEFKPMVPKPGPFRTIPHTTVCSFCGVGCRIDVNEAGRDAFNVTGRSGANHIEGELCAKGRFGTNYLGDDSRVKACTLKGKGEVEFEEAIEAAAAGLGKVKARHGAGSIAVFASPRLPNEQLYVLKETAARLGALFVLPVEDLRRASMPPSLRSAPQSSVAGADLIVTIGTGVLTYNPVMMFNVRRAVLGGAKLIHIGMAAPQIKKIAAAVIDAPAGETKVLSALCGLLAASGKYDKENLKRTNNGATFIKGQFEAAPKGDKGLEELAAALADTTRKVIFVCNADAMLGGGGNEIRWAYDTLLLAGRTDSLIIARDDANRTGFQDIVLAGARDDLPAAAREAIKAGKIKGALVVGQDLAQMDGGEKFLAGLDFLVAADMFGSSTTEKADVVVPLSPIYECEGSMVSFDGNVVKFDPVFEPLTGVGGFEFLAELLHEAGGTVHDVAGVKRDIARLNPAYEKLADESVAEFRLDIPEMVPRAFFAAPVANEPGSPYKSATTYSLVWEKKVR
jgi:formate dehydrogenase major subunit